MKEGFSCCLRHLIFSLSFDEQPFLILDSFTLDILFEKEAKFSLLICISISLKRSCNTKKKQTPRKPQRIITGTVLVLPLFFNKICMVFVVIWPKKPQTFNKPGQRHKWLSSLFFFYFTEENGFHLFPLSPQDYL